MNFRGYARSVVGDRAKNQDAFLVSNEKMIYAVADGVGGGLRGEVASQMAVDAMGGAEEGPGKLRESLLKVQDEILKEAIQSIGEAWMGTTLTCVRCWESGGELIHVGDSRCYLFRDHDLVLLTEDHEIFDPVMQAPVLSSYLGLSPEVHALKIQEESLSLMPGDRLLLCSDGLYKQLAHGRIVQLIEEGSASTEELLENLCTEAAADEYSDNVTIVYIEVDE